MPLSPFPLRPRFRRLERTEAWDIDQGGYRAINPDENANQLRSVAKEIANIKSAVRLGRATEFLLGMLEDAERRREVLLAGHDAPMRNDTQARLEKVLAELPERVQAYLEDVETLLAQDGRTRQGHSRRPGHRGRD